MVTITEKKNVQVEKQTVADLFEYSFKKLPNVSFRVICNMAAATTHCRND